MTEARKLFLVVPCLNEADTLPVSLPRMLAVLDGLGPGIEGGIIVADDGSTDGTGELLAGYPDARVRHLPLPHSGQQGAILGGVREALALGADAVVTLDADLQDDPSAIPAMVQKWQEGKEVVYGVRSSRGEDTAFKKVSAWFFYTLMHLFDRRRIPGHADFRLMTRPCLEALLQKATPGGDLIRNIVPTLGLDGARVYYERGDRKAGESKYGAARMMAFGWKGLLAQPPVSLLLLCLFTFLCFFLTSVDSPMHDEMVAHGGYIRHDSAWYFMCGKAWLNGMVPYVDFADSKGPLLWLVYALAYLLSPESWAGLFWINAAAYIATAILLFKVSLLLTDSPRKSLWMGMMLNAAYFIPLFIFDDKAEAIALPFVALSMLMACRSLWSEKGGSFFWWGFAFGAIVLIKYSVAAMTGIFLVAMAIKLRGWKAFGRAAGAALGGFAVAVVPLLTYFLFTGSLGAFIQEYFLTTFQTIDNILGGNDKGEFLRKEMVAYWVLVAAGAVSAIFALKKNRWFPPVAASWFLLCLGKYARTYYFIPVNVLMVFTALAVLRCLDKDFGVKRILFGTLLAATLAYVGVTNGWTYKNDYFYSRKMTVPRERAQEYLQVMGKMQQPRVLYWFCGDHGYGIRGRDLPACKYWAIQAGYTKEMAEDQERCAREHRADAVFVDTYDRTRQDSLLKWGYKMSPEPEFGHYRIFTSEAEELR